jgi:hypothetical protein
VGTQEERNRRSKNISLSKKSLIEFCLSEVRCRGGRTNVLPRCRSLNHRRQIYYL